jgi:hypothetical protein
MDRHEYRPGCTCESCWMRGAAIRLERWERETNPWLSDNEIATRVAGTRRIRDVRTVQPRRDFL